MRDNQINLRSGQIICANTTDNNFAAQLVHLSRNDVKELCVKLKDLGYWPAEAWPQSTRPDGIDISRSTCEEWAFAMWVGRREIEIPKYWLDAKAAKASGRMDGSTSTVAVASQQQQTAVSQTVDPDEIPDFVGESNMPEIPGEYETELVSESLENETMDAAAHLQAAIEQLCKRPQITAAQIQSIVRDEVTKATESAFNSALELSNSFNALLERTHALETELAAVKENRPHRIEIVDRYGELRVSNALCHKSFDRLFAYVRAALMEDTDGNSCAPNPSKNIMLIGPAGAGKTFVCEQIAEALSLPFSFNGAIGDEFKVLGFKDADGDYAPTEFFETYTNGGLHLWDELDASSANACLALNAFLANGKGDFPKGKNGLGGIKKRHPKNIIIASCNVWGGPTSDYVGRNDMDEAFRNRFGVRMAWDYDERLEKELAQDDKWVRFVQGCRSNVKKHGVKKFIISPRASESGAHSLRCGIPWETVVEDTVRCGLSDDKWNLVKEGL